ncbi:MULTISPECIES: helix-turn-helix domain-containing protein [Aquimarina]|uniref:Helix-turn-helix transcriptional regulator n=1 Tax=Aquimarina algiphila TaxID=2047982 RepID=A0A554VCI0_9FLAO|nr:MULTISPECIES: helix-turn-helix transcriptional regulator [Aquimarina]TSE04396.1 helix-turn-helix transcriptional regulator [Aquimarina algiphila]
MVKKTDKEKESEKRQEILIAKAIGQAIRYYRQEKDMSQSDVCAVSNLERNVFQRYDAGKVSSPKVGNLIKIAKALEITPGEIINKAHEMLQANPKFNS